MRGDKAKVLVVDDHSFNRTAYSGWLADVDGIEVLEAASGTRALELASEHDFALFVLDLHMPGMNGYEIAALLRQEPRSAHTPVVYVTSASPGAATRLRGHRMGGEVLTAGPVDGEILAQKARLYLKIYQERQALEQQREELLAENEKLRAQLEAIRNQNAGLKDQAMRDALTRLPNREMFASCVESALHRAEHGHKRFAVAFVDLDGFKPINDRLGHGAGDQLLIAVAKRLREATRATDTVARIGGDEFVLLIEGLDSCAGASRVAEKALECLVEPVRLRSGRATVTVQVGASVGVAVYPDHASDSAQLMRCADSAMYQVKRQGGGSALFDTQHGAAGIPMEEFVPI